MKLKCVKSTLCNNSTGDAATLLKLVGESTGVKDYFGETNSKVTYYRFVSGDQTAMLDKTGNVDLEQFDIVKQDREFADETTGEMITRTLKYLYAKRS